jgi:hypothetical protein
MEVKGKIKIIGEIKEYGAKGFRKAELVLDVTEKPEYPQFVNLEFTQDNTDLLSKFKVGDSVNVSINLGGRQWVNPQGEAKYFNSITGWRIEAAGLDAKEIATVGTFVAEEEQSDLPF